MNQPLLTRRQCKGEVGQCTHFLFESSGQKDSSDTNAVITKIGIRGGSKQMLGQYVLRIGMKTGSMGCL